MAKSFHDRPDSTYLYLVRQCPYLHTLVSFIVKKDHLNVIQFFLNYHKNVLIVIIEIQSFSDDSRAYIIVNRSFTSIYWKESQILSR